LAVRGVEQVEVENIEKAPRLLVIHVEVSIAYNRRDYGGMVIDELCERLTEGKQQGIGIG